MKKIIIRIAIALIAVTALVYLYLVLAVNADTREFKEFKERIERDSVEYNSRRVDSNKVYLEKTEK